MGLVPLKELIENMKHDINKIKIMFPKLLIVWSDIVPRSTLGGLAVRQRVLEERLPKYYIHDGVYLSDNALDLFLNSISAGIEDAQSLIG
ncbi:hypothetical protein XELAEV_18030038mg [Xenopus laevis]|uniref:Uncharacterized protein n=1 Tax=Xenopus laevis TaxID=8355 RepID=A0A974HI77_XENLA|nr:hypothetical protein XELAEV_18030038mg [Xenopus laevis]